MKRAIAVAALLVTSVLATPSPATAAGSGWVTARTQYISGSNFYLKSIDSPQRGDVWAVGYRYTYIGGALEFRTVAEHSTGGNTDFTLVPTPDIETAPAQDFLADVSGSSSKNVYSVGWSSGGAGPDVTIIQHWDGSSWTMVQSPNPGQYGNILEGVATLSSKNVWAVGAKQDDFYQSPMALHWNGRSWKPVAVPNPDTCTGHSYLTDISAISSSDIWASGWCQSHDRYEQGYLVHWDGTSWSLLADGTIPANSELYGVSASDPDNIWTVGYSVGGGNGSSIAMHYDGTSWSQVAIGAPHDKANLAGVVARPGGRAWSVGAGNSPQPPFAGPATVRFGAGTPGVPVAVGTPYGSLSGVAVDKFGKIWAAGTQLPGQYNQPLIVYREV